MSSTNPDNFKAPAEIKDNDLKQYINWYKAQFLAKKLNSIDAIKRLQLLADEDWAREPARIQTRKHVEAVNRIAAKIQNRNSTDA